MKKFLVILMVVAMANFLFVGCLPSVTPEVEEEEEEVVPVVTTPDTIISIPGILGVTVPVYGQAPDLTVTASTQYTGVTTWKTAAGVAAGSTFAAGTVYVATTTLTAKTGFTLTGVTANFFTVAGAAGVSNPADSGVATSTFPITAAAGAGTIVSIVAIPGVVAPVFGAAPDTAITATTQYTGTIAWKTAAGVAAGATFAAGTVYVATITLTPVAGFTFTGVTANYFTVTGVTAGQSNPVNSGVVTATYIATSSAPTVVSAKFVDSDTITIVFSEAVTSTATADYTAMATTFPVAVNLIPTVVYGTGTTTISVDFTGYNCNGLVVGTVNIGTVGGILAAVGLQPVVAVTTVIAAGGF